MDGEAHEATYAQFTHFVAVGSSFVAALVAGLAVGAVKHAWISTVLVVILAHIATAIGLFSRNVAWRAPVTVLVLGLLMLVFY